MPCLMPILEEKWYQQSVCWNSGGSWQEAYSSIALWSCKSPFHGRLSISIMHQWRDMEEKFWDCLATGSFSGNKGNPRMTALVGSASNPLMTEARLCRSWTGWWVTKNSEPGLNFNGWKPDPPNDLTIWFPVAETTIVTVSLNLLSYGWLSITDTHTDLMFLLGRSHRISYD